MEKLFQLLSIGCKYALKAVLPGSSTRRTNARRHLALVCLRRLCKKITFRRNGFIWAGPVSCCITQSIFLEGHYQDAYIQSLNRWIKADKSVIVNVGANIGDVALPLSRTGKRVLAIEPNPSTFVRLQFNVAQNSLEEKITCCQFAISHTAGIAELVIASQPGNSELIGEGGSVGFDGVDQRREVVSVRTISLDELLKSLQIGADQVALVWSDTQGFESQVIESGVALWTNGTPLWIEVWPKGLDCHGGTRQFIELCNRYFRYILSVEDNYAEPSPILALESIIARLKHGQFTDVLLIP